MGHYATVGGTRTWYDVRGAGEPLVLLHGGLVDSRDFTGNLDALADGHRLYLPDRRGHGRTPDVEGPFTADALAGDVIAFVEEVVGGPVPLLGYSAGATVALHVALRRPDLVERLVLISGAYAADGMLVRPSLDGDPPEILVRLHDEVSPDGPGHFRVVLEKVVAAVDGGSDLTPDALAGIGCRTLVVAGDDDIVAAEHTLSLFRALPDAELAVVPGTSHALLHEKPALCVELVEQFLGAAPTSTLMPMRRLVNNPR
jgi:pimeloyl-ACP methyl ester carboxylesterase